MQEFEKPFEAHYKSAEDLDAAYLDKQWQDCHDQVGHILLAECNGKAQGLAIIHTAMVNHGDAEEYAHASAHIGELVVVVEARGTGIGKALLEACEKLAIAAGRDEITIGVLSENLGAKKLYNEVGYVDSSIRLRKPLR